MTVEQFVPSTPKPPRQRVPRPESVPGQERAPRQERAQATRAAIVQAAATVFAERGYARTTLDGVADEAGVTKGALYFHFASKRDLANAVIAEETRVMTEGADRILHLDLSSLETLILLIRAFTERIVADVVVAAGVKLTTEELVARLDIDEPYETWGALYADLFGRAIAEGDVVAAHSPDALSRFLISLFTGVQLVSNSLTQRADVADRVAEMWQIFLPSIVPAERLAAVTALPALRR